MPSSIYLIFIGTILVIPNVMIATRTRTRASMDAAWRQLETCSVSYLQEKKRFYECTSKEFTEEKINAMMTLHNETEYMKSKHICRKQDEIFQCIGNSIEQLKSISNKAVTMIPFIGGLLKEGIRALCENDGELLSVFMNKDDSTCFSSVTSECRYRLGEATDMIAVNCEYLVRQRDAYDQKYICLKYLDFMECAEANFGNCSEEMKNAVTRIISKWEQEAPCSNYPNDIPNY